MHTGHRAHMYTVYAHVHVAIQEIHVHVHVLVPNPCNELANFILYLTQNVFSV